MIIPFRGTGGGPPKRKILSEAESLAVVPEVSVMGIPGGVDTSTVASTATASATDSALPKSIIDDLESVSSVSSTSPVPSVYTDDYVHCETDSTMDMSKNINYCEVEEQGPSSSCGGKIMSKKTISKKNKKNNFTIMMEKQDELNSLLRILVQSQLDLVAIHKDMLTLKMEKRYQNES